MSEPVETAWPPKSDFPKARDKCGRHRWMELIDLETGRVIEPVRRFCWHCGSPEIKP